MEYPTIEFCVQHIHCDIPAKHDGKGGCNTVEYATVIPAFCLAVFSMAWYGI